MTIKTFNTGRQYTADGQRIAYLSLAIIGHGKHLVAMLDIDRHIDYMLAVDYPFGDAEVLAAYDNRTFADDPSGGRMHMCQGLEGLLREAAANHGMPKPQPVAWVDDHYKDQLINGRGFSIGVTPSKYRRDGENNPLYFGEKP